jgi:hypothetical protein
VICQHVGADDCEVLLRRKVIGVEREDFMQPQLIAGRYKVLRAIGRGGMGTVWLCRDEVLGREVAVKQIGALPGESATETRRAMREARSAAALNHPNAVAVYDVVDHVERPWLVMEYVEGETLADEISRDGQLSPRRVADIGAQLAGALARAHERRIVHRDIKPGNVLIDKAGRPKISDFGIARGHGDDQLTQIGFVTGTPGYLSPELARGGDPHSASDVWALGATLYAAVEGRSPYEPRSNPIALLRAIATERPRAMTQAGALEPAIDAMMHVDPARRWDMATSAKRLGGIAAAADAAVVPRTVGVGTAAMPVGTAVMPVGTAVMPVATAVMPVGTAVMPVGTAVMPVGTAVMPRADAAGTAVVPVGTAVMPRADAAGTAVVPVGTAVLPAPVESTQRLEAAAPASEVSVAGRPEVAGPRDLPGGAPVPTPEDRRRGPRWLALAYVALLVAALGVAYLLSQIGEQGTTSAVPSTARATTPVKTTSTAAPKIAQPPRTDSRAHKSLDNFVKSYYSDVTKDTDRTWDLLTPRMQDAAGDRDGYDGFWKTIEKVKVNQIRPNASGTNAVVKLTFTRDDGTTSTETHRFTFVNDDGDFLIESDRFLG